VENSLYCCEDTTWASTGIVEKAVEKPFACGKKDKENTFPPFPQREKVTACGNVENFV
jgi:hypothetical protein